MSFMRGRTNCTVLRTCCISPTPNAFGVQFYVARHNLETVLLPCLSGMETVLLQCLSGLEKVLLQCLSGSAIALVT